VALRAVIVGGGIGGTAAAVALVRAGIDVQVYEQAQQLAEVGDATQEVITFGHAAMAVG
jgi:salicylate hydroxylase